MAMLGSVDTRWGRVSFIGANLESFHRGAVLPRSLKGKSSLEKRTYGGQCVSGSRSGQHNM